MAYIQRDRNTVAALHSIKNPVLHLFWFAQHQAETRVSHRETCLLAEHTHTHTHAQAHRHTQRASYKNIRVSPSLADGCYYGNAVTNRECVLVCLHQ